MTPEQRFLRKVTMPEDMSEHWIWQGNRDKLGYGRIRVDGKLILVHRFGYELWIGAIPDGMVVRHLCHFPSCVNPWHLKLGTPKDNTWDAIERGTHSGAATHCPDGHPYEGENLYRADTGGRMCKICRTKHDKKRTKRKQDERKAQ